MRRFEPVRNALVFHSDPAVISTLGAAENGRFTASAGRLGEELSVVARSGGRGQRWAPVVPWRIASAAASVRLLSPSLARTRATCCSTVRRLM
jgi:hypothetical protein